MLTDSTVLQAHQVDSGSVFNIQVASITSLRPWSALGLGLLPRPHSAVGLCTDISKSRCVTPESIHTTDKLLIAAQTALKLEQAMLQKV